MVHSNVLMGQVCHVYMYSCMPNPVNNLRLVHLHVIELGLIGCYKPLLLMLPVHVVSPVMS